MIKTNSELPITLLKSHNEKLNDFDLLLFHLYISEPEYKEYYDKLHHDNPDREMIFDNSAYELFIKGETLDIDEYGKAIDEFNPQYFVLPDTLMDMEKTIVDVKSFIEKFPKYFEHNPSLPTPIAVIQGNSAVEFTRCLYMYKDMGIDSIAIPFHNTFFKDDYGCNIYDQDIILNFIEHNYLKMTDNTDDLKYAIGRCIWVKDNLNELKMFDKIHFLGSHCPAEKGYYEFLKLQNTTMDTGYPVKCAIKGYKLGEEPEKPDIIIDQFMYNKLGDEVVNLIETNINIFKGYGPIKCDPKLLCNRLDKETIKQINIKYFKNHTPSVCSI